MFVIHPGMPAYMWPASAAVINLDAIGEKVEHAFTCETGDPITHLGFACRRPVGTPGTARLSLQTYSPATMRGTGIEVAGVDVVPTTTDPTGNGDPTGVLWYALAAPFTPTLGEKYVLVYEATSGTWDASNYVKATPYYSTAGMPGSIWPCTHTTQGGVTTFRAGRGVFGYRTATRRYGMLIHAATGAGFTYVGNHYQLSAVRGFSASLDFVRLNILKNNTATRSSVFAHLRRDPLGDNELIATSETVFTDDASTLVIWGSQTLVDLQFLSRPAMEAGETYAVMVGQTLTAGTNLAIPYWVVTHADDWQATDRDGPLIIGQFQSGTVGGELTVTSNPWRVFMDLHLTEPRWSSSPVLSSPFLIGDF